MGEASRERARAESDHDGGPGDTVVNVRYKCNRLDGNASTSGKTFWDCYTSYQGVSVGWVDQYHQSTDGQQVVLNGLANASDYYLVSTTNPTDVFFEQDKTNDTEWVKFTLSSESNGNRKVTVTDHSPCETRACAASGRRTASQQVARARRIPWRARTHLL